jgi:hypothetical protein
MTKSNTITKARITKLANLHRAMMQGLGGAMDKAIAIGEELTAIKDELPHGEFGPWIEANMPFSRKSATNWMRIYAHRNDPNVQSIANLTDALNILKLPATPGKPARKPSTKAKGKPSTAQEPPTQADPARDTPESTGEAAGGLDDEPEPPVEIRDADMRLIPEHLTAIFEAAAEFKRFMQTVSTLKRQVGEAMKAAPDTWARFSDNEFQSLTQRLRSLFKLSAPFIVCAYCAGEQSERCDACRGSGFLTSSQARCVPVEMRPAVLGDDGDD